MEKLRLMLTSLVLVAAASFALSCGAASSTMNSNRQLQSITLSPATADGQTPVQFIATGHYNAAPYAVTPQPAVWAACLQGAPASAVSVTNAGLAQCTEVGGGPDVMYSIIASDMTNCNVITACGGGCTIAGTAQLTCPTTNP